jgi:hypothetical protein
MAFLSKETLVRLGNSIVGDLNFASTSNRGIQVENNFGWADLIGDVSPRETGAAAPILRDFIGGIRHFAYQASDQGEASYHIPHDYVPGSNLFLHLHWSHNGTAISGDLVVDVTMTYAKGHQQASFHTVKTTQLSVTSLNITTTPQHRHRVDEIQFTTNGGSSSMLNTADLEVDGLVLISWTVNTIPTITGSPSSTNLPFFLTIDLHYQSTGIPTKNKTPNFYS